MTRRGLTLLELLLAIALLGGLLGSMFTFLHDLMSTRERALAASARQLAAATLIERIESDLLTCLVGDSVNGAGVEGDTERLAILCRRVPVHLAARGIDEALADLERTEYRFESGTGRAGRIMAARRPPVEGAAAEEAPLGTVAKVRFRYRDATGWRETYDSLARNELPVAVEVAVWFDPWPGDAPAPDGTAATPERLTFDASGAFDEEAVALATDLESTGEPQPDRVRVILIPDAAPGDPYGADAGGAP